MSSFTARKETVSPRRVSAELRDGRVSIDATTRAASLSVSVPRTQPLSETGEVATLTLTDGDALEASISLKGVDAGVIREVLEAAETGEAWQEPTDDVTVDQ